MRSSVQRITDCGNTATRPESYTYKRKLGKRNDTKVKRNLDIAAYKTTTENPITYTD